MGPSFDGDISYRFIGRTAIDQLSSVFVIIFANAFELNF